MGLTRLTIEPTNICNLNCKHCWSNKTKREKGYIDYDFFCNLINEAKKMGIQSVTLNYSGEPTLHPDFAKMIEYVNNAKMRLAFATNGTLLNDEIIEALSHSDRPSIGFSMHSKKYHKIVYDNIRKLLSKLSERNKTKIGVSVEVGEHDENTLKWLKENCPCHFSIKPSIKDMKWDLIPENFGVVKNESCTTIHRSMYILWDGKVTLCCRDISCELAFGDVKKNGIAKTFMSSEYTNKRIAVSKSDFSKLSLCSRCELYKYKFVNKI